MSRKRCGWVEEGGRRGEKIGRLVLRSRVYADSSGCAAGWGVAQGVSIDSSRKTRREDRKSHHRTNARGGGGRIDTRGVQHRPPHTRDRTENTLFSGWFLIRPAGGFFDARQQNTRRRSHTLGKRLGGPVRVTRVTGRKKNRAYARRVRSVNELKAGWRRSQDRVLEK